MQERSYLQLFMEHRWLAAEENVLIGYSTMSDLKMQQGFDSSDNFDFGKYKQQISNSEDDANSMVMLFKVKTSNEKLNL